MASRTMRIVGASAILSALMCVGCSDEQPPQVTEPGKLTPGLEAMKGEMMKAYQTKSIGKAPPAEKK
jgi:hypothetical protein